MVALKKMKYSSSESTNFTDFNYSDDSDTTMERGVASKNWWQEEDSNEFTLRDPDDVKEPRLRVEEEENQVRAVISGINNDHVFTLLCTLPSDKIEIELPHNFIPESSRHYGAPVWVSIDSDSKVRQIKVSERHELVDIPDPEDIEDLRNWVAGAN